MSESTRHTTWSIYLFSFIVSDYFFTLFMKFIILFTIGIITWFIYANINWMGDSNTMYTSTPFDLPSWLDRLQMEIGCHSRFPISSECVKSIVKERYCDLDKLSYAVARHETAGCTVGTGKSANNCHWMLIRVNGKRVPIVYKSSEESHKAFKKLWTKRYWGCPDMAKAVKYSGNDRAGIWLNNVEHFMKY